MSVKVAVVTGGHSFDVPGFHDMIRSMDGADACVQHIDDFCSSTPETRRWYDVVLFYTMMMETPKDEGLPWYAGRHKSALESLGETKQGIFLLHHAILAYPEWPVWSELVGIHDRRFGYHIGETVRTLVGRPNHPITRGIRPWTMVDETYTMADTVDGSDLLLSCEHLKSMKTLAWARHYRSSRVFCYQAGHDNKAYANPHFREVVGRGIQWCGGAL